LRLCLKKPFTKIGLVEWLKVKALISSLSTTEKRKKGLSQADGQPAMTKPTKKLHIE
jgi:hypothetical protein